MGRAAGRSGAMHVVTTRQRRGEKEYTATLLRRSYRQDGKVKKETLANLSHLPDDLVEVIRRHLKGERLIAADELRIERSLPAGHVNAVLAVARRVGLAKLLDRAPGRERDLALALICQRVLCPGSKLACARLLSQSTLADELGVRGADEDDLYAALDWLGDRQQQIEKRLAARHLKAGDVVLYDLSSSYFEGRACPLATLGYSRDGKRGTRQIVYGLMTDRAGWPVSVQVFAGNTLDAQTVPDQLERLKTQFALKRVVLVCDRGMVTQANMDALKDTVGLEWITALKAPQVKKLAAAGTLQSSLFDELNLGEISSEQFPGERLIVCRNPLVAAERARKREDLLTATETALAPIAERVKRGTLTDAAKIGLAVGPVIKRYRMSKHFIVSITDGQLTYQRDAPKITAEAALDGFYVLRTSVPSDDLTASEVVCAYKDLQHVERAFGALKSDLQIRPIHHRLEHRVRAHVLCCMLALYIERHLRQAWTELTFHDEQPPERVDPVAKAQRSPAADHKATSKTTRAGHPAHSYRTLLAELALQTRNTIRLPGVDATCEKLTEPTPLQIRALQLAAA